MCKHSINQSEAWLVEKTLRYLEMTNLMTNFMITYYSIYVSLLHMNASQALPLLFRTSFLYDGTLYILGDELKKTSVQIELFSQLLSTSFDITGWR